MLGERASEREAGRGREGGKVWPVRGGGEGKGRNRREREGQTDIGELGENNVPALVPLYLLAPATPDQILFENRTK